jgi:outer membrane immunogenic protein
METVRKPSVFIGTFIAAFMGCTAAYADGYNKAPPGVVVTNAPSWSGFYLGLSGGWQRTNIDGVVTNFTGGGPAPADQNWNVEQDSAILGGIIGIQHQFGNFVLGLEANWSGTLHNGSTGQARSPTGDCVSAVGDRRCDAALTDVFTVGPRLGWAAGNTLLYATGGYAHGSIKSTLLQASTSTPLIRSESDHDGWFLGAGIEWVVWKNMVFGLEYQRVHLDDENHRFTNVGNGLPGGERATFESDTDIIRARLTVKLDTR